MSDRMLLLRSVLRTDELNVLARYQVALSHPSHPSPRTNHHHHKKSEYKNKAASPSPPRENQTSQSKNDTVQSFPQHLRANVRVRPTHRFLGEKISYLRILITLVLDARRQRRTRDTTHAPCTTAHTKPRPRPRQPPRRQRRRRRRRRRRRPRRRVPPSRTHRRCHRPRPRTNATPHRRRRRRLRHRGVNDPSARSPHCAPRFASRQRARRRRRRRRARTWIERVRDRRPRRRIATTTTRDDDDA